MISLQVAHVDNLEAKSSLSGGYYYSSSIQKHTLRTGATFSVEQADEARPKGAANPGA